jgi:hypothetical protein
MHAELKIAKQVHTSTILGKPNVVGVGLGYKTIKGVRTDDLCVVAMVEKKLPKAALRAAELVPSEVNGFATDVVQVGTLWALQARTDRWRPAPGGVSVGHYLITAGTLGAIVRDRDTGQRLILSNNHVLANSNDAQSGDAVLQPGPVDGGREGQDDIARLERYCPIQFNISPPTCSIAKAVVEIGNALAKLLGSKHRLSAVRIDAQAVNEVDAAVARPVNEIDLDNDILDIGEISGTVDAALGMGVRKSGRTTAFTTGEVSILDATVTVNYGSGREARFENQIVTTAMSQGGDSGSLLVAANSLKAVGLLFAGSEQVTLHNPIDAVLDCLEITI